MNALAGIVVLAGLFVIFGWAERHRTRRSCGSCSVANADETCSTCPLYEVDHD
jgi:hypothetical protein